ncbi:MAG: tetratricopeptide repeat protein [Blastocatellia bacterium]
MKDPMFDAPMIARNLSGLQKQLLQALRDGGPGLLLELAVRVLKFPEDVRDPLRELETWKLVETQAAAGGRFGSDLYSLTGAGLRVLQIMSDPAFVREPAPAALAGMPDPAGETEQARRRQEAELLNKLGDAAKESGNLEKAIEYYQQALSVTRGLAPDAGGNK